MITKTVSDITRPEVDFKRSEEAVVLEIYPGCFRKHKALWYIGWNLAGVFGFLTTIGLMWIVLV